jgi:hypothetical protein
MVTGDFGCWAVAANVAASVKLRAIVLTRRMIVPFLDAIFRC